MSDSMTRRHFVGVAAGAAGCLAARQAGAAPKQTFHHRILNFHGAMEYRPLGSTGLMVSAVSMGGHWKGVGNNLPGQLSGAGYNKEDYENVKNPDFIKNRDQVVSRAVELGINYIDACTGPEVLAYGRLLKGRRGMMHLGYSWFEREPRFKEWRSKKKLIEGLDLSLREAGLAYVDLWRITLPLEMMSDRGEVARIEEATAEALMLAKKQGKACFTGVSVNNRIWLKSMIEDYPKQLEVVLFPYTPKSKELPIDSVFEAIKKHDVGVFGITPFAGSALFRGNGAPDGPYREEDDKRARLALRHVLGNPKVAATIPGMANALQVENAAMAVMTERRKLDLMEKAELERVSGEMWARLRPNDEWLKRWEYV